MAYDIRYDFLDKSGKVVGSAGCVFSVTAHQLLGDEALYSASGKCRPKFRLVYINAYDNTSAGASGAVRPGRTFFCDGASAMPQPGRSYAAATSLQQLVSV
ncbi:MULTISPECIES: hypothetical protein [Streptomyces]|uniref:Uncharacterized protein n=1 Tax=Streptomyces dengpaensis TaxID=2049881 RepID=A0ABN5I3C0_9ACTN|nr:MULTISPECIES: hypothetical protein [Streptomyces]AVH57511.1 hypothetical protein C4B68_18955 [Streptomyces dengpaensis]PIB04118.1 hypothetical protein B1C81_34410 [Streptomyces sp. HG99]